MSYTDDFFKELNKKNKKNKKEENDTTKNKTKSNSGYANEFYSALNDDIAPLPSTATRYYELAPTELEPTGGEKDSWFKTGGFSDGVDGVGDFFGDLGETVAGTVGDLSLGMVKGVGRTIEGIVDLGTYAVGGVGGLLGFDDFKEKAKDVARYSAVDEWTKPATDFLDQYSVLGNKADMVSEGLGQVAAILLTAGVGAAAGLGSAGVTALTTGVTGLSSMGTGIGNAYSENANDTEAFLYGLGSGAIEAGTELLSGGLGKAVKALGISRGIGGLDDIFAKKLSSTIVKSISNESVQKVLGNTIEAGVKASGEGVEEVLSGLGSAVMKWLTYEKDEDIKKLIEDEDLLEQFVVGAITSSIAQGADYVKANKSGRDFVTGYTNNEQAVIDKEVEKRVSEKEKNGKKLSNKEIGEIEDQVRDDMEHGQIDIETIEEVLGGDKYTSYKNTVKNEDALKAEYEQLANIKKSDLTTKQEKRLAELEAMNLEDTTKRNSLRKELNDTVFPQLNDSKLAESYKEIERKKQKFEADLTKYKGKQREAVERAVKSGVLNNTYRSHVLVDILSRIEADKGIVFDYTNNKKLKESGFAVEGVRVNGYANKSTGTVTLNVQSQKAWQSVVGHEIAHILKDTGHYKALKDALFAYAESKGELANRRTELTELYQNIDADVDEELTADLVGDYLFTDKAFINRLTGNRTLFQKVYDEIKYLWSVATGKEKADIEKVKREFDRAWKEFSAKGVNGTDGKIQYSLTAVDAVQPKSDKWARSHTTDEAMAIFPNMWNVSAEESEVRNPTQITSTVNTYRKIYNFLQNEGFDGKILDASSGLGYGTKAGIEEYGFDVEDIEPYPDANYTPKYQDYSTLDEKYDVIISNAVLNVLPQDQRDALVVKMGELLNDGGRLFVNVRGKDVETLAKTGKNIHLGNMEWIETVKGSYQKGFTKPELVAYLQDALGDGFTVKPTNIFGGVAAVVTKDGGKVQYSVSAETDADYMSAVERGDTETAQRMVDEAAKKAGYNSPVLYHGSPSFGFTQIYTKKSNDHISFFATDSMQTAGTYSGTSTVRNIGDTSESSLGMYQFYANTDGMVEFDAKGAESNHIALGQAEKDYNDFVYGGSWYSFATAKQLAKYAKQKGYTGVIIKNVVDAANPQSRKTLSPANVYIFFSPQSQLKSADPVTYDDNGNVIPLSQRFNEKNDDIRYSLSNEDDSFAPVGNYSTPFNELAYNEDVAPVEAVTSTKEAVKPTANTDEGYPDNIAPVKEEENAPAADEIQPMTEDEANAIQDEKAKADKAAEGTPKSRRQLYRSIIERIKSAFKSTGSDFDEVLKNAKNLSTFATVDNTPQRVMEKALGYKEGQTLADLTVNKVAQNETAGIKWLNSYTNRKNGLLSRISKQYRIKPGSKESAAAQMYAEGFYVNESNEIVAYGDAELAQDFPDVGVQYRIKGLAHDPRIRQIYDETLDAINASRRRNGYPEIQKLDNYFLHFRAMDDTFSRLGLPFNPNDIRAKDLPTDLNGVTADLKPGQPYFASAMHRKGKRTSFDLLGGLERYLTSAKNQIYHIDDIQTLRALRNYIADTYGQANGLEGIDTLSEEEAQERIEAVYNSHLSTFAKFLNEEANILAGKTALIDRGLEGVIGRRGMTFLSTVQKQTGSNMVGFNISSSLTNFLPVAQALAKTNKFDFLKAFAQTTSNKIGSIFGKNDGFAENSPVMVRRKGADRFYRTPWQKASDAGYVLMSAVDNISTELIARTKFNELTRKGMDEQTAHFETDKWVSRLMGDRSLGQQPQLYNSKTLGFLTQFQLEVRNQLDSQFYDTIQEAKVSNEDIENALVRNAKTAAKVTSTFLQLAVAQHLFGKAFESVAGYNPAFDIISVLATMFGFDDEEDSEDTVLDNIEQGIFDLLEDLPYTSTFTGGRIPIASALPIKELIKGEDSYGNEKSRLETLKETAPYYVLPGGYGQLKKTYQGLNMFSDEHPVSGSYTDSGKLRFPVEDTMANKVQAAVFGQYASENAREYFDNDYAPLNPDKYAVAKAVGGYSAYKTYSSELYDIKSDKDANGKSISGSRKEKVIDYINNLDADYYTKIILFKSEYPSDDTYNADIVNYVINGDFTYDEKVSILTELGFRVTADGEIYAD